MQSWRNTSAGCSSTMAIVETLLILKWSARLRLLKSRSLRFHCSIEAAIRRSTVAADGDDAPVVAGDSGDIWAGGPISDVPRSLILVYTSNCVCLTQA